MVTVVYFDTSALLKHYVTEIGSGWVNNLFSTSPVPLIFTSHLTVIEATCAFARRLRDGTLSPSNYAKLLLGFDYDLTHQYQVTDVLPVTIDKARELANKLRAYDAVQLATAWLINQTLVQANKSSVRFVSADNRLNTIARVEGLLVDNPNHYP